MNDSYLEVLQQYEGELLQVRRGRGAWICQWTDGIGLLKEYRGTLKRLEFEEAVLSQLKSLGISQVDQYRRNREGGLLTQGEDGTCYVLKDWFSERECNLRDSREILAAVSWIGRLHRAMQAIPWQEDWNLRSILAPGLSSEMERHSREMRRVRTFITNKRKKSEFELCVIRHFDQFYRQADEAQRGLKRLEEEQKQNLLFLCHGDLDQHHVLMGRDQAAFIEFSQMHRGVQAADLYRFMRKGMEKHDWNERLGLAMLEEYHRILPVTEQDRACLYYLFLYPEKYWKQLNYYYNANKAWIPEKNIEKLKNLEVQQEKRMRFLEKIKQNPSSFFTKPVI